MNLISLEVTYVLPDRKGAGHVAPRYGSCILCGNGSDVMYLARGEQIDG